MSYDTNQRSEMGAFLPLRDSWRAFCLGQFSMVHLLFFMVFCFAAYGFQVLVPAFRADDIIQLQPASGDSAMFLLQGRWGYYWIFEHILDTGSGGLGGAFIGITMQFVAAYLLALVIGLRFGGSIFVFCAIATISLHFAFLFSFDSTRLAYPLGNLLAAVGLYLCYRNRPLLGVLFFALAPGFYPASIQVAIAGALGASLKNVLEGSRFFDLGNLLKYALLLLAGLLLYTFGTKFIYSFFDQELIRSELGLGTMFSLGNFDRFVRLFSDWSVPFLTGFRNEYLTNWVVLPSAGLVFCFVYFVGLRTFVRRSFIRGFYSLALLFLLLISPYFLSFAAPLSEVFPPRTLFVFGIVYAVLASLVFENLLKQWSEASGNGIQKTFSKVSGVFASLVGLFLAGHILMANEYALDDHLASQADILAVNRIISRIESVAYAEGVDMSRKIPIYVLAKSGWPLSGPRGDIRSARYPEHAQSWFFSFLDNRFDPVFGWSEREKQHELRPVAENAPIWPHEDSVMVHNGAVIVVF